MKIAFYAPLKPLDSPVPSGDRQMGRLIVRALEAAGHEVIQPSRLRLWLKEGSVEAQKEKERAARDEARALVARFANEGAPELWLTYHLYHKAPDWLGTSVADALDIPYVAMEASRAVKRREGPWSYGFAAADTMIACADTVIACHRQDAAGLCAIVPPERLTILPPFIDAAPFADVENEPRSDGPVRLVTVAMMRSGDKMASYRVLAEALAEIRDLDWRLRLVGDGEMREEVLAILPLERVDWFGQLAPGQIASAYAGADLFVWPAVHEAYGLVFLEAQASGLPVVGGATGGVPDIVRTGETGWLAPVGDGIALAETLRQALARPDQLAVMGTRARAHVLENHDIGSASVRLDAIVSRTRASFRGRNERSCKQHQPS
ncbi:glycosyltransferase involved in cell wall biosynthesis [Breoghania corrubedonensis]|uniref:Glycosyltransferase involved in cell wall biosynthesis n=1 Tax=Breoghania corrubedonensis TaxID=665038 RepID=A0A2T5V1H5_9HYPH|nr:glycosyltransferase family 4 protein [Breoghania corrubedonensis]PTW57607.1 glycosyltransferase involved in cell wall biosynthesis [Breoghania corrubedonensis]